ncbi:hypothetical protein B0H10DRAFT_1826258, partial [Mycena sp. CBHHK59/15]
CHQCHLSIRPEDSRAHVGGHIICAIHGVRETDLYEQVVLPSPCRFCGCGNCQINITKNWKITVKVTSSCPHQHKFSYSHAKKFSSQTPSTNVPVYYGLCSPVPPWKTPPAFWKYSIYPHIRSAHPQNWDNLKGAPCNLSKEFVDSIAISGEELLAFDIWTGSSTAPSAKSLVLLYATAERNTAWTT